MNSTKSDFNVEVVEVTDIRPHPNADKLEMVYVYGTIPTAVKKGDFKLGDRGVFIPQDAIVPLSNPAFSFLGKPGQTEARIRSIRLRGQYSEGLLIPISSVNAAYPDFFRVGTNCQELLGIRKWQSPGDLKEMLAQSKPPTRRSGLIAKANSEMPVYGLDSGHRFSDAIKPGTKVVATEKIHGCNARYMFKDGRLFVGSHRVMRGVTNHKIVEFFKRSWMKVKNLFKKDRIEPQGDIWWEVAEKYELKDRLAKFPGYVFYGEIYGQGVQRRGGVDFVYDSSDGRKFRVFDIYDTNTKTFKPYYEMKDICFCVGLSVAPWIGEGLWGQLDIESLTTGKSILGGRNAHTTEGVVIRTDVFYADKNRVALKFVGKDYKLLGGE